MSAGAWGKARRGTGRGARLLLAALLLWAVPALAELRRLEVVGAAPAGADAPANLPVRDAALASALAEAVERVARSLLEEEPGPEALRQALGDDLRAYTPGYRLLEDRGERRALLVREAGVATEYVVLAEVRVDVDAVRRRLREAGLLSSRGGRDLEPFLVTLEHPVSYLAYERVREGLTSVGARRAVPVSFDADAVEIEVWATESPDRLLRRLEASASGHGLSLRVLELRDGRARLRARADAPAAPGAPRGPGASRRSGD